MPFDFHVWPGPGPGLRCGMLNVLPVACRSSCLLAALRERAAGAVVGRHAAEGPVHADAQGGVAWGFPAAVRAHRSAPASGSQRPAQDRVSNELLL